jgi:hypothetical protein
MALREGFKHGIASQPPKQQDRKDGYTTQGTRLAFRKNRGISVRQIFAVLLLTLLASCSAKAQVGAFQTDCNLGGKQSNGAYQFVATCAGRAPSPNGQFAIVQKAYTDNQPPIELQDAHGRTLTRLKSLSDDMPLVVSWSPDSQWFYVNHHVGSFMDTLQIFEIVGRSAVERPTLVKSAVKIAAKRYPCLRSEMIRPNGVRWTRDSSKIVMVTISASYACGPELRRRPGTWRPLWMIGNVRSGDVDAASIRVQADGKSFQAPKDGPYSQQ